MHEDDHINPNVWFTKDTENRANIFKADDIHDEKKHITREENITGGNRVTDHSERETDKSVIDHVIDKLKLENLKKSLLKTVNKLKVFVFRNFPCIQVLFLLTCYV